MTSTIKHPGRAGRAGEAHAAAEGGRSGADPALKERPDGSQPAAGEPAAEAADPRDRADREDEGSSPHPSAVAFGDSPSRTESPSESAGPAGPGTPKDEPAPEPDGDLLLNCLQMLAAHFERPASVTVLTAGLPLENGALTLALFERAAGRIGLEARHLPRAVSDLTALHLPALVFLDSGAPVVLLRTSGNRSATVYLPEIEGTQTISLPRLERMARGDVVLVKPVYKIGAQFERSYGALSEGHWFWSSVRKFWRSYMQVILAGAAINVLALGVPLFIMNVYDRVLPNKAMSTLWVLGAGLMLALVFDFLLKIARAHVIDYTGRKLDVILSSRLFEKILSTQLKHRPSTTGAFANRIAAYESIREFFTSNTIALFVDMVFVVLFLFVIAHLAGWIVVIPLAAVLAVLAAGFVIQHLIGKHVRCAQEEAALRHSILVESVASIETLKSLRAEGHMLRKWENFAKNASNTSQRVRFYSALGFNFSAYAQQMVTLFVVVGGVYRFAAGDMSMGAIIATVILSGRTVAPLGALALTLARARQAWQTLSDLNEVMELPDEQVSAAGFVHREIRQGKLAFRQVSFAYPGSPVKVLDRFDLTIGPGERVGIIGKVGSGKTTIGRLVTGLYLPDEGEILIDDVDLRQYHPQEVRRAISLIVQEADLFFGSVKDNIAVANPLADDTAIIEAARNAGVDNFVSRHPLGYDMPVGERGSLLSGGQRQAVALARALLTEPRILFLDEPSSSMDMATERQLVQRLKQLITRDQTLIVTTHRNAMLELVDRLVVLEGGRVAADGPKDKVIAALTARSKPAAPRAVVQQAGLTPKPE